MACLPSSQASRQSMKIVQNHRMDRVCGISMQKASPHFHCEQMSQGRVLCASMMSRLLFRTLLTSLAAASLAFGQSAAPKQPTELRPSAPTSTVTFYVSGVECPSCVYSVTYSISQLAGVSDATPGQVVENFVNVTFDPKKLSLSQIARAVHEAPALHGTPYQASLKVHIPGYAKEENQARVDALLTRWEAVFDADLMDKATGEFVLYFRQPQEDEKKPPTGLTLAEFTEALTAPAPKGLGLSMKLAKEDDPR